MPHTARNGNWLHRNKCLVDNNLTFSTLMQQKKNHIVSKHKLLYKQNKRKVSGYILSRSVR